MTETMTGEGRVYLFFVVDHCSTEILGFHVDRRPNRWAALEPVRQAAAKRFGSLGAGSAEGLVLRGTMVKIAEGAEYKMPAKIDDPAIPDEIRDALQAAGLG